MSDTLPDGWIKQYDQRYKRHYWADTKSNPPRATWVHPYEDEQYLAEHPEIKAKQEKSAAPDPDAPPSYAVATKGGTSRSGSADQKSGDSKYTDPPNVASAGPSSQPEHKRRMFGRLKDKAIGTKEEREEQKRVKAEQAQLERKRRLEEREERRRIKAEQAARAEEQARQARLRELEEREAYMRAYGGYAPYHPSYAGSPGYNPYGYGPGPAQSQRVDGGNTAALLLGGLAGGLLLGDIFSGGLF